MSEPAWHLAFSSEAVAQGLRGTVIAYRDIAVARVDGKLYKSNRPDFNPVDLLLLKPVVVIDA